MTNPVETQICLGSNFLFRTVICCVEPRPPCFMLAKQKRPKVSKPGCPQLTSAICVKWSTFCKSIAISFFIVQLSHPYMTTEKTIALAR